MFARRVTVVGAGYVGLTTEACLASWSLDWSKMAAAYERPIVAETRNLVDPAVLRRAGLTALGLGRRPIEDAPFSSVKASAHDEAKAVPAVAGPCVHLE